MSAFLFVLGVYAATASTDVLSSYYLLGRPGFEEVGFSPFPSRGANTAVKLGLGGVAVYALYRLHDRWPKAAWVIAIVAVGLEAIAVGRNVRFLMRRRE
jgi:hypothetical protein